MATVKIGTITSHWALNNEESKIVVEKTSAREKGYFFSPSYKYKAWDGRIQLFNPTTGSCPSGLVPECIDALNENGFGVEILESPESLFPERPDGQINFEMSEDHQIRALQEMCSKRNGIIDAATNSGKTKIAEAWCALHDLKVLYLVPTKELLHQTLASFKKDTNLDVGFISAQDGWEIGQDVTVCLVTSVAKRKGKASDQKSASRFKEIAKQFDAVIVDECHHLTGETWRWVLRCLTNATYRYGLSGSPWGNGDEAGALRVRSYLGPVIATVKNSELIEKGWSAKPKISMIKVSSTPLKDSIDFMDAYESGIVNNDLRNNIIAKICDNSCSFNKSVLIISTRLAQCDLLSSLLKIRGLSHRIITGESSKEDRKSDLLDFKNGEFKILISNVLSEGIDVPNLNCLVFASGGKSSKQLLQRIGRGLRKKPDQENVVEIYDFMDESHHYLESHYKQRVRLYKKEGFEIEKTEINF